MATTKAVKKAELTPAQFALRAFTIHNRINCALIDALSDEAWQLAQPSGKGRTIAENFAHMHDVRLMWMKAARISPLPAKPGKAPAKAAVKKALKESEAALQKWLLPALETDGQIANFKPDAWAFLNYLVSHESHHRGQILLRAKMAGCPVDKRIGYELWNWGIHLK